MRFALTAAVALLLLGCSSQDDPRDAPSARDSNRSSPSTSSTKPDGRQTSGEGWDLQSSGEGVALTLFGRSGDAIIRLFCPSGESNLLVNVGSFRPIGSEERLSFGSGGQAVALVAKPRGVVRRGGVSAAGVVPANLKAVLAAPLMASYGAQTSGPHPVPPANLSRAFAAACLPGSAPTKDAGSASKTSASACLMQGSERLRGPSLRAVGTEPFWGARIEGRCVTYSHPDDQAGTRLWTRYTRTGDGGSWSGALDGRPFTLRVRAQANCSDGMSDQRYPYAVDLLVGGEQRTGCAERL